MCMFMVRSSGPCSWRGLDARLYETGPLRTTAPREALYGVMRWVTRAGAVSCPATAAPGRAASAAAENSGDFHRGADQFDALLDLCTGLNQRPHCTLHDLALGNRVGEEADRRQSRHRAVAADRARNGRRA